MLTACPWSAARRTIAHTSSSVRGRAISRTRVGFSRECTSFTRTAGAASSRSRAAVRIVVLLRLRQRVPSVSRCAMETCGCPPTGPGTARPAGVHHVIVNVRDLARAREFYGWLLPRLGYPGEQHAPAGSGWFGPAGSFSLKTVAPRFAADALDKDRVGLCEL